jgi:hypothetical protein|tara:strand:- start:1197 stop:1451 length:255 start_codon:yes stop_codon:yes gene_type:complete
MNGKGDKPRPVNKKVYNKNYENIFNNMKFYEVKQQLNNLHWQHLGFFKNEEMAKKYEKLFNTKTVVYPTKVIEHSFMTEKDIQE